MTDIVWVTPEFAIGPQIELADMAQLRDAGFAAVINARPDDEDGTYLTSGEAWAAAYLDPFTEGAMSQAFPYVLMLIVLLIRPQGLFGWKIIERV